MPQRNLFLLILLSLICFACFLRADKQGRLISHVMNLVEHQYYCPGQDSPVERNTLTQKALSGMLRSLDTYSGYLPPEAFEKMNESLDQKFAGIGAEILINPKTRTLTVCALIYGSPAVQAGILPGDQILAINGETTQGLSASQAADRLRGTPGTIVSLKILHPSQPKPMEIDVDRRVISTPSVVGDRRLSDGRWTYFLPETNGVAYVKLTGFGQRTAQEMASIIPALLKKGMKGLIIDLRDNPGGTLNGAVGVCDLFVNKNDLIVSIHSRSKTDPLCASEGTKYRTFPIAVLINGESASASEITASCLQDNAGKIDANGVKLNAAIIGSRSFGKGTVQDMYYLTEGQGAVKITVAGYVRPNGKNIHRNEQTQKTDQWGVKPDPGYEVELSEQENKALIRWHNLRSMAVDMSVSGETSPSVNPSTVDKCIKKAIDYIHLIQSGSGG